jgi:hypothetical protein
MDLRTDGTQPQPARHDGNGVARIGRREYPRRRFLQGTGAVILAAGTGRFANASEARPAEPAAPRSAARISADRAGVVRFGVNYLPSRQWWFQWYDWDPVSIDRDLRAVADLGFDHIRIQCLWPAFQPNPGLVSESALDRLAELLDIAHRSHLQVEVTLLNGYLSGFLFRPAWQQPGMDYFTDATVIQAQKDLLTAVGRRVGDHPALLGVDLGNEPDWIPYIDTISGVDGYHVPTDNAATPDQGQAWATTLLDLADTLLPGKVNVVGANANAWAGDIRVFTPSALADIGTVTSIHDYYYPGSQFEQVHAAEYMVELAKAYAGDPARTVWVEEFGYSVTGQSAAQQTGTADYAEAVLRNLMRCGNLFGWAIWASHDISPALTGFAASEYHFGMLDLDNKPTVLGNRLAALMKQFRATGSTAAARSTAVVIPDDVTATYDSVGRYFFRMILQAGIRPALVLQSRSGDASYLAARGITTLVRLDGVDAYLSALPPAPLAQAVNNIGVTSNGNVDNGNFDGAGKSYPAEALAAAGIVRGATITAGGMRFTWPAEPDDFDNMAGPGREILLDPPAAAGELGVLGAASFGPYTANATVTYSDGTSEQVPLALSDWTLNSGTADPVDGNQVAIKVASLHAYGGQPDPTPAFIFAAELPVNRAKRVARLSVPGPQPNATRSITVSSVLGATNTDDGLSQIGCGDGTTNPITVAGKSARQTSAPNNLNMYFQFASGLAENGNFQAVVTVSYFDTGSGTWQLQYDSNDSSAPVGGAYSPAGTVQLQDSGTWKTATFTVSNARFAGRQNCGADFRIAGPVPVTIHEVGVVVSGSGLLPDSVPHVFALAFAG